MLKLNNLAPAEGATKNRKRVGRGPGSGHGKTATRGTKGHSSRSGSKRNLAFEGGQMRVYRRVPKRGFHNRSRIDNQIVNVGAFEMLGEERNVTIDVLRDAGFVRGQSPRVKVLGVGEINAAYTVRVHLVSESARKKIEAKGGSVELVPYGPVAEAE
jgi:large subunit ribosomal protein L15